MPAWALGRASNTDDIPPCWRHSLKRRFEGGKGRQVCAFDDAGVLPHTYSTTQRQVEKIPTNTNNMASTKVMGQERYAVGYRLGLLVLAWSKSGKEEEDDAKTLGLYDP